jgi:hypothetical protein
MASAQGVRTALPVATARTVPHIGLEDAIDKARVLWKKAKRSPILVATAATHLGCKPTSSTPTLFLAALKKFGLIQDEGTHAGRQIKLSELGYQIVADVRDSSPDRDKLIQQAALLPKPFRKLWEQHGHDLPDDKTLLTHLMLEERYSQDAARLLIRVYRSTISYAGLGAGVILPDVVADEAEQETAATSRNAVGESIMDKPDSFHTSSPSPPGSSQVRTLYIPLEGSKTFQIQFPVDLTKEDFDFVLANIKLWEPKIVAKVIKPAAKSS